MTGKRRIHDGTLGKDVKSIEFCRPECRERAGLMCDKVSESNRNSVPMRDGAQRDYVASFDAGERFERVADTLDGVYDDILTTLGTVAVVCSGYRNFLGCSAKVEIEKS